jgi:hypothetical protein
VFGFVTFGLAAFGLAACSSAVKIEPPAGAGTMSVCTSLDRLWPPRVDGQPPRRTSPDSPATAAWGDPAIIVRCGVGVPPSLSPTSQLFVTDGVQWLPERLADGYRFTTVGRTVNIEVVVPGDYSPEAGALVDLAAAIKSADRGSR